jgi:hypothetical protein
MNLIKAIPFGASRIAATNITQASMKPCAQPVVPETILWLDALRPHLARAGLLSARLAFERARRRCHGGAP